MADIGDVAVRLAALTEAGRAPWKPTGLGPHTFRAIFETMSVLIAADPGTGKPLCKLSVIDKEGREIDWADSDQNHTAFGGNPVPDLQSLYDAAKRKALDVPRRLQELMDSLNTLEEAAGSSPT